MHTWLDKYVTTKTAVSVATISGDPSACKMHAELLDQVLAGVMIMWDKFTDMELVIQLSKPCFIQVYTIVCLQFVCQNLCICGQLESQSDVIFSFDPGPLISETLEKLPH